MLEALASAFSLVIQPCYDLTGSWWAAIFLFTAATKVILMPLSLWCQWNSIVMVRLMPDLNRIKVKHFGDSEAIGEAQNELNKKNHYHPLLSLIPLGVQILILFGLVDVIRGIAGSGAPGTEFLGLVPAEDGGLSWIMPPLAALSSVIMGIASNHINPLQREQSTIEKNTTNATSVLLSLFLAVYVTAGMAFYWVCSNLLSILVQVVCNIVIDPRKHVDYDDLAQSKAELDELNALSAKKGPWWRPDPLARRERADYRRFFNTQSKHLVFYSERSGFYKYFKGAIEWLLANSTLCIHYITSDPDDQVFELAKTNPRLIPYFIREKRLITLMMKLDCDVEVSTQDDLENYYIKRSYIRKDIKYCYMPHAMTSMHLTGLEHSYDHYDAILCAGPHQVRELRRLEEMNKVPVKELPQIGDILLDAQIAEYEQRPKPAHDRTLVLVAPSWQEDNLLDLCLDDIVRPLLAQGCRVVVRPHPEYLKRYRPRWEQILARYADVPASDLSFEQDFNTNESIFDADVLVTDWSSIYCEFAFVTGRPTVFVNSPCKLNNPNWEAVGLEPVDFTWRHELGRALEVDDLKNTIGPVVAEMAANPDAWREKIMEVRSNMIFNLGHSSEEAGRYLLNLVLAQQESRKSGKGVQA